MRALIHQTGLSQVGAAQALELGPRTVRRYCAGEPCPKVVLLALERLVELRGRTWLEEKTSARPPSRPRSPPRAPPGRARRYRGVPAALQS